MASDFRFDKPGIFGYNKMLVDIIRHSGERRPVL
jgi:hypothetical protein